MGKGADAFIAELLMTLIFTVHFKTCSQLLLILIKLVLSTALDKKNLEEQEINSSKDSSFLSTKEIQDLEDTER